MKCDIVLTVWNEPQLTKDCVESLIKHTHYPYRIIAIDNGSKEETKKYLEGLKKRTDIEMLLIRIEQNAGFVKAANRGLQAASAPYVCLLSNDTLVTPAWLGEMVEIAEKDPQIGILNPSSNTLGQYLSKGQNLTAYAKGLKASKGQWQEMGHCGGFCMVIKREVIKRIGFLDEIYGLGYGEDTDFCRRAQQAGFVFARAKASYVYHKTSSSFKKMPERKQIFKRGRDIVFRRWGRRLRIAYLTGDYLKIKQDKINTISLQAARGNHQIWLFLKRSLRESPGPLPDHFNIKFLWLNDHFYRISCIYKILKRKRKKEIDIVFSEDRLLSNILKRLKFYHQADVLSEPTLEKARQLWKQKSVYP